MSTELPFDPCPFLRGSKPQTVIGSMPAIKRGPKSVTRFILLPDKDYLALEVTTPKKWKKTDKTVVFIHGLCGSHKSACLVRMAKKLQSHNIRAIRVNLRGCGSGKGRARRIYHGGQSDDIFEVLRSINYETPESEITLIGFSLGGNISLKLAGELGIADIKLLKKVIAINPPVDLLSSVKLLGKPHNRIYENYFIKLLKEDMDYRCKTFSDVNKVDLPEDLRFYDFDRLYTAPQYGFIDVLDYYKRSSSKVLIPAIKADCNILFSDDDPIIEPQMFAKVILPENVRIFKTKKGGHIGYFSLPGKSKGFHWIDNVLLDWILEK